MTYKKDRIFAAILAGGQATRLGGLAKGNLEIAPNFTIIQHLITEIHKAEITDTVISANVTAPYEKYYLPIIADNYQNFGPIAGIEAVLNQLQNEATAVLFLPCDLPNITAVEIELLKQAYLTSNNNVYALTQEHTHPLCAIIKTTCLTVLQSMLKQDIKRITHCWQQLDATGVFFTNSDAFVNINTYQDLTKR